MSGRDLGRRLTHVGLGSGAFLLPLVSWQVAAGVLALGVVANTYLLPRLPGARLLLRAGGDPALRGLVFYPLTLLVLTLVLRERTLPVQLAWLALALGDGLAPLLGRTCGSPSWPWNPRKSVLASSLAFTCAFAAMLLVAAPLQAGAAALAGLLAESLPWRLDDNLTIPMLACGAAWLVQGV